MKVVIAGAGSVGRHMARQLLGSGHEVTLIDQTADLVKRHRQLSDDAIVWKIGDACELTTLRDAGCTDADVVAAVTGDDEDNLVISLLAKQEFGVPRVVARVNNPDNEWMYNDMWGVDLSVSTPHLLTAMVEEAVSVGSFVRLMTFERGNAKLAEVTLASGSPAIGRDLASLGMPRESTIVAVIRDGHAVVPRGDTVLRDLDEVIILVGSDAESDVRQVLVG